jgi:hypothetical protein
LVTAFRSASDDLALIVWTISQEASGQSLSRAATASAGGTPGPIAVARLTSSRFITALRDMSGNLILIVWDYANGVITRRGSASAGAIYAIELATLTSSRVVTAFSNATNQLGIIVWDIDANGSLTRKGAVTGNAIQAVAVNSLSDTRFATSVRDVSDESYNLRVDVWEVDASGKIQHKADASDAPIGLLAAGDTRTGVFPTAVWDDGVLKIIAWDVTYGISRAAIVAEATEIDRLAAATLLPSSTPMIFVTASELSNDNLELISWRIRGLQS